MYRIKTNESEIVECPNCGHKEVEYDGFFMWLNAIVREYKCKNCGTHFEVDYEKRGE